jgi:hypothetical protein
MAEARPRGVPIGLAPGTGLLFGVIGQIVVHLFGAFHGAVPPVAQRFATWWPAWFWVSLAAALLGVVLSSLPKAPRWRFAATGIDVLLLVATFAMMLWGIVATYAFATAMPPDL